MKFEDIGLKRKPRKKAVRSLNKSTATENEIQTEIIKYLQANGFIVVRINSGGFSVGNRFMKSYTLNAKELRTCTSSGLFDVMAFRDGLTVCIECKRAKGTISPEQTTIHELFKAHGFNVIVARCLQDVIDGIK